MMRYYRLLDDVTVPKRWHLGPLVRVGEESRLSLCKGMTIDHGSALRVEVTDPGLALDFCLTGLADPIACARLAAAVASVAGDDVQRLQVEIDGRQGFEALNATRVVKCLDERRSEFMKWPATDHRADLAGQYRMVPHLRIDPQAVPVNAMVFRIEGWLIALVVSEAVKIAMERTGCMGAKFEDVTANDFSPKN